MIDGYSYLWLERHQAFCIFDDMDEPVMETLEYLSRLSTSRNTQRNHAVALKEWLEFLANAYKIGIHFTNAKTKHIVDFQQWLRTPPKQRDMWERTLAITEYTLASTRNQYLNRIAHFYERYVAKHYPDLSIDFKRDNPWKEVPGKQKRITIHKERIRSVSPVAKAIPMGVYRKIREQATKFQDSKTQRGTAFRNAILLDLLYIGGLRRGEVTNIDIRQFENIDRSRVSMAVTIHETSHIRDDNQNKRGGRIFDIPIRLAIRIYVYILHYRVKPKKEHFALFTSNRDVLHIGVSAGDPLNGKGISKLFKKATIAAGFPQYTVHDCRHSMVTNANLMGVGTKEIMDQAGHVNPSTTEKYRSRHAEKESLNVYMTEVYDQIQGEED